MKTNERKTLILGIAMILAFSLWTMLVQTVDVRPVGQCGTNIGFAAFNRWFFEWCGVHMTLYTITDWLGLVPAFICLFFGVMGFSQLIGRKSLFKIDCDIILLGIYYIIVISGYLIFEMIPINYRPIPIDGHMEASYPSSTTLLVLSVMPTLIFQAKRRIKSAKIKKCICIISIIFSVFTVSGRLVSGVHWFTDIFGSVLLSAGLFNLYKAAALFCDKRKK